MKIRAKTFEAWLKANFKRSELKDIADYGANTGWPGLSFFWQTTKLYEKFKDDIWKHITEESEGCGYNNPFRCLAELGRSDYVCDAATMENWLVHYMAESMAYRLTNAK